MKDARTTPPKHRIPALVLVGLFASYMAMCTVLEVYDKGGAPSMFGTARSLSRWSMFTLKSRWHKQLKATALIGGQWVGVDLPALYPTTWESGRRYQRPAFLRKQGASVVLGNSICQRDERKPRAVRIYRVRWKRRPGETQEPKNTSIDLLSEWDCRKRLPMPGGVVL